MSEFEPAFLNLMKHEGGLVNDIDDAGGITNRGMSLRYLEKLVKQNPLLLTSVDLDNNAIINSYDIQNMSEESAKDIYRVQWWNKYGYGKINNQSLANKVFNLAVNIGPKQSAIILQQACNELMKTEIIAIDGILGSKTYNFINQLNGAQLNYLIINFINLASKYYQNIVNKRPVYKKFLKGWLNRLLAT